ncbi:hypothetical protein [Mycobacterium sp. URHB0044]|jgi:hypothetical protein|uniref:hypothetical protein n=1 Tax=Mycobacterium sp. URHB0044 TaxID=1380386 RepID=UPI00048CDDD1|nr:hypothetical protein [Mycobacterium sp. URHB0044]
MRSTLVAAASMMVAGMLMPASAAAEPSRCDDAFCVPGITPGVVLGAGCPDTGYYVFGTTSWGRLVFCDSPRRYEPRYFRSPPMVGIKDEGSDCVGYLNSVAQAPDGLFLSCAAVDGATRWVRGDA